MTRTMRLGRPSPQYSRGQLGTTSPEAPYTGYHSRYSARLRTLRISAGPPRLAASRHAAGTCSLTHCCTAARTSSCEAVGSIGRRPLIAAYFVMFPQAVRAARALQGNVGRNATQGVD